MQSISEHHWPSVGLAHIPLPPIHLYMHYYNIPVPGDRRKQDSSRFLAALLSREENYACSRTRETTVAVRQEALPVSRKISSPLLILSIEKTMNMMIVKAICELKGLSPKLDPELRYT